MKKSLFIIPFLIFIFSCAKDDNAIKIEPNNTSETQTLRPEERQVIYAHFVMKDVLEYRLINNYITLELIQNNIEFNGFDTNQDPEAIQNKIEQDNFVLNFLNETNLPLGPGGPIGPPPPPRPCLDELHNILKRYPKGFHQMSKEELMDTINVVMFHICEPVINVKNGYVKIVFNELFSINNLVIQQNSESVSDIIDVFIDDNNQTIVTMNISFEGDADMQFNLDLPIMENLQMESKIQILH